MTGRFRVIALATLTLIGAALAGCGLNEFDDRDASVSAEGITSVRIIAEAGDLQVLGESDIAEIDMSGRVFARARSALDGVDFTLTQNGEELTIEILSPGNTIFDAIIRLPDTLNVTIEDASGDIIVEHVANLDVSDESGDIDIRDVARVTLTDSSGDIRIDRVTGGVVIGNNDSGDLIVENVEGDVHVVRHISGDIRIDDIVGDVDIDRNDSGDIDIADVGGSVRITSDSTGDIHARRIDGDFTVAGDTTGDVTYDNVGGLVTIP